jgi:hypothetical protein
VDLYIHSPIRIHGVALNQLSTGTTLPYLTSSRQALGPLQPPIQWVPWAHSPGVKRSGREVDRSHPTSAEVKKMWIYTSSPPYAFMA